MENLGDQSKDRLPQVAANLEDNMNKLTEAAEALSDAYNSDVMGYGEVQKNLDELLAPETNLHEILKKAAPTHRDVLKLNRSMQIYILF